MQTITQADIGAKGSWDDSLDVEFSIPCYYETGIDRKDVLSKVHIIVAIDSPIAVILGFYSSHVMNMLTPMLAISLYPKWTFEDGIGLLNKRKDPDTEKAIQKYIGRHFKIDYDFACTHTPQRYRHIGDRHTWSFPLYTNTKGHHSEIDPVVCGNTWKHARRWTKAEPQKDAKWTHSFEFKMLHDITLRFQYTQYNKLRSDLMPWINHIRACQTNNLSEDNFQTLGEYSASTTYSRMTNVIVLRMHTWQQPGKLDRHDHNLELIVRAWFEVRKHNEIHVT
ncbi:hypothetical protein M422DRAFT_53681 [Sphaerobolus stellatus SS14]|uniref:Uncharacterized protein n=1 Tax=Sphaerobolus stellatus (strain SS14) TaxID=990650 RepID=A0A0C9UYT4_SPHS4|nr:hypothetical protein M422DRAFT_53681 [Sphaerobolus stellatus SS14]